MPAMVRTISTSSLIKPFGRDGEEKWDGVEPVLTSSVGTIFTSSLINVVRAGNGEDQGRGGTLTTDGNASLPFRTASEAYSPFRARK